MKKILVLALLLAAAPARAQFTSAPACADGIDNDGDLKKDYSVSPGQGDPGCDAWNDNSETDLTISPIIRPRLAVAFDTSGSMRWNVCTTDDNPDGGFSGETGGDGTEECLGSDVACCFTPPHETELCVISGTTHQNRCDSSTCGNGEPDDSRMFKVKVGVHDAIAAYGEMEYSLYRFAATSRDWPTDGRCGGWDGSAACAGGANRLVKFAPENQEAILQWMDQWNNWDGPGNPPKGLDFELRSVGATPLGATLEQIRTDLTTIRATDPVADCRPYRVVLVTDGQETCDGDPVDEATLLHQDEADVYVIGFAGGANSTFQDEMNDIAFAGGTGEAYFADSPEQLSAALAEIVAKTALVEKCNGLDDDCDGVKDNGFNLGPCDNGQQGACFREGSFVCISETETQCNAPKITPPGEEPAGCNGIDDDCDGVVDDGLQCTGCGSEICNGLDDDCDGTADNGDLPGEGDECQLSEGECTPGHLECEGGRLVCKEFVGPTPEVCDGKDNNCDGVIDGMVRACYTFAGGCVDTDASAGGVKYECKGRCRAGTQQCTIVTQPSYSMCTGQQGPIDELCNGIDDDCDGVVDDGFAMVGMDCERGAGLCKATGKLRCTPDGKGVECDAPVITGSNEVCNGIDDDCNGTVDDLPVPPPPPIGMDCGTCGGKYACRGGLVCVGGTSNPEVCNGVDDDCNNIVDDGVLPEVGDRCVPDDPNTHLPLFVVQGECRAGHKECIAAGLACVDWIGPSPEVCDGRDNDCDGTRDDAAACPSPSDACVEGACVSPCAEGEFPCPFGQACRMVAGGRYCVANPCVNKTCGAGEVCDPQTGMCMDPCAGKVCPDDTVCRLGRCVDCFVTGCPAGQQCLPGTTGVGKCAVDRCAGVTCGERETCVDGACQGLPCADGCAMGERCEAGRCVGVCSVDLCFGANCAPGTVCNAATGRCVADPCRGVTCGGATCTTTCEGLATCGQKTGVDVLATGGGGFQCEIGRVSGEAPRGMLVLVLFGALALIVRRRSGS